MVEQPDLFADALMHTTARRCPALWQRLERTILVRPIEGGGFAVADEIYATLADAQEARLAAILYAAPDPGAGAGAGVWLPALGGTASAVVQEVAEGGLPQEPLPAAPVA